MYLLWDLEQVLALTGTWLPCLGPGFPVCRMKGRVRGMHPWGALAKCHLVSRKVETLGHQGEGSSATAGKDALIRGGWGNETTPQQETLGKQ